MQKDIMETWRMTKSTHDNGRERETITGEIFAETQPETKQQLAAC